jgi:hypothetical protein
MMQNNLARNRVRLNSCRRRSAASFLCMAARAACVRPTAAGESTDVTQ